MLSLFCQNCEFILQCFWKLRLRNAVRNKLWLEVMMVLPRNPLKPVKRRRKKNQVCLPCFFCDITFLSFIDLFFQHTLFHLQFLPTKLCVSLQVLGTPMDRICPLFLKVPSVSKRTISANVRLKWSRKIIRKFTEFEKIGRLAEDPLSVLEWEDNGHLKPFMAFAWTI